MAGFVVGSTSSALAIRVRGEALDLDDPRVGGVPGSLADQHDQIQAAINLASAATGARQSEIAIHVNGQYRYTGELTFPDTDKSLTIYADGPGTYINDGPGALFQTVDPGAGKCALKINPNNPAVTIRNVAVIGAGSSPPKGDLPAAGWGIYAPIQLHLDNVTCTGFRGGLAMQTDHLFLRACRFSGNGYGIECIDNPFGGLGDIKIDECSLTNNSRASIGLSDGAAIANAVFTQGHMGFSPFAIYRYARTPYPASGGSGSNQLTGVAVSLYDLNLAVGGSATGTNIAPGTTVTAVSGTSGNYTVTLSQNPTGTVTGVLFSGRPQAMAGVTFIHTSMEYPGNAMIYDEAGGGVFSKVEFIGEGEYGTGGATELQWPGKPTTLANIQVDHIVGMKWTNGGPIPQADDPTQPYLSVMDAENITVDDPTALLNAATISGHKSFVLRPGGDGAGYVNVQLGQRSPGSGGRHATVRQCQEPVTKGDLLERYNDAQVRRAHGTALPAGFAGADYDAGDCAVIITAGAQFSFTARNLGASSADDIPNQALVKLDLAHPGGVTAATNVEDGLVVGQADVAIPHGQSGATVMRVPG